MVKGKINIYKLKALQFKKVNSTSYGNTFEIAMGEYYDYL